MSINNILIDEKNEKIFQNENCGNMISGNNKKKMSPTTQTTRNLENEPKFVITSNKKLLLTILFACIVCMYLSAYNSVQAVQYTVSLQPHQVDEHESSIDGSSRSDLLYDDYDNEVIEELDGSVRGLDLNGLKNDDDTDNDNDNDNDNDDDDDNDNDNDDDNDDDDDDDDDDEEDEDEDENKNEDDDDEDDDENENEGAYDEYEEDALIDDRTGDIYIENKPKLIQTIPPFHSSINNYDDVRVTSLSPAPAPLPLPSTKSDEVIVHHRKVFVEPKINKELASDPNKLLGRITIKVPVHIPSAEPPAFDEKSEFDPPPPKPVFKFVKYTTTETKPVTKLMPVATTILRPTAVNGEKPIVVGGGTNMPNNSTITKLK